jgi:hypothetical protein
MAALTASATGAITLSSRSPAARAATSDPATSLVLREADGDGVTLFDAAFAHRFDVTLPRSLALDGSPSGSFKAMVDIAFDPKAFASSPFMIVSRGSAFEVADVQVATIGCRSEFTAPHGSGAVLFHLPISSAAKYPHENVGPVGPNCVTVSLDDGRSASFSAPLAPARQPATVAGAELSVGWTPVTVRDQGRKADYRVPTAITCTSVGPRPLPAGSTIQVRVDARLTGLPRLHSATLDRRPTEVTTESSQQDLGSRILTFTTSEPLPAHSVLELQLEAPTERRTVPTVQGVLFATVSFGLPSASPVLLRNTGRTTVADLSRSGEPLLPHIAVGTI